MGTWRNINLTGDGVMRLYEMDSTENPSDVFNIDVSGWMYDGSGYFPISDQATANTWKNTVNSFLTQLRPTATIQQLHAIKPSGGPITYVDENGDPVVTVYYKSTNIKYYTLVVNGSSFGDAMNVRCSDISDTGYADYNALLSAQSITNNYCLGIKLRVMEAHQPFIPYDYPYPHVVAIDDVTWMPANSWHSVSGEILSNTGALITSNNNPEANINHSYLAIVNDVNTGKRYLREYVGSFTPASASIFTEYGDFTMVQTFNYDITDAVDIEPEPVQEDGFVNEIENRFSPRVEAGSMGGYIIPADGDYPIETIMSALMTVNAGSVLKDYLFGSDGKEYVMGLRWYYGLNLGFEKPKVFPNRMSVKVGGYSLIHNALTMYAKCLEREFYEWSTHELSVPGIHHNYLDYLSSYQLYLPYYGFLDIDPNDIVDGSIKVYYNINLYTGFSQIIVQCKSSRTNNQAVKCYTVSCQVGEDVPYGTNISKDMMLAWAETCAKAFTTGAKIGAGIYGGPSIDSGNTGNVSWQDVMNSDEYSGAASMSQAQAEKIAKVANRRGDLRRDAQYAANKVLDANVNMSHNTPRRSGSGNCETGNLDELFPYLLITSPIDAEPQQRDNYVGRPTTEVSTLASLSGFTQVAAIAPESTVLNANAPKESYMSEIISLLNAGVYL